jgi:predicted ABC-type ATPase
VPEVDVRRRFRLGLSNLFHDYLTVLDEWWIYDAVNLPTELIAAKTEGEPMIFHAAKYDELRQLAGAITS